MFGTVKHVKGKFITVELEDVPNSEFLELLAHGGKNHVNLDFLDNRGMTAKQNKLAHALIADIAKWSGDIPIYTEQYLKYYFMTISKKWFSHGKATRHEATEWIDYLIKFVLKNNVPLPKLYDYLLENNSWFYYCLKYRRCCICGKHADVAHLEEVGMGRNRHKVDHTKYHFMALCREHHTEQHTIGILLFLELHKIIPVYLDYEERKKLHIGG